MNSSELNLAGYASIVEAAISVPILFLVIFSSATGLENLASFLQIVNLVLFIYTTYMLINFLEEIEFQSVNKLLWFSIFTNLFVTLISLIAPTSSSGLDSVTIFNLVAMSVYGILMIIIGIKLQSCANNLHGLIKPFTYCWIIGGICLATVVLTPLGIIFAIALGIIQGMIFFREADLRNNYVN